MAGSLRRISAIMRKEANHILRDTRVLYFALVLPVVLLFLFGFAISFDVEHIPLTVVDRDQSAESRELVRAFSSGDLFDVAGEADDEAQAESQLRSGVARAALIIPTDYSALLTRGSNTSVQLLLDGSDANTASVAAGYASAIADALSMPSQPAISAEIRTFFNPSLKSSTFIVPGLTAVILGMIAVMLTALTVSREYEQGSMEQLFTTPVNRIEIILGKLAPYFLLGLVAVLMVLGAGVLVFSVPVRGSIPLLLGISALFLLAMFAQGLLISTVARSQAVASQIALMSTLLPALLLSGFIFPIDNMPVPLQALAYILPPSHFVSAIRDVLLRGLGPEAIWQEAAAVAAFFLVLLMVTVGRFRRTVA